MKKLILVAALGAFALNGYSAVTIQYYNQDSKDYTMTVKLDGTTREVKFEHSRTSSVTIQGGNRICIIETSCGKVEVKDGAKIEIKDGCIKVTN